MANLFPRTTGLPMTVWVSPRGATRHAVTIKAGLVHGDQVSPTNAAVVGVRPWPHVVSGRLLPADEAAVFRWLALNAAALAAYWDGQIDTVQLGRLLKPLS
ncbi:MAG TPA: hypothetical protein VGQ90_07670 [Stellaceae bacterium]|jgi:hypothetical protein|nr:hypothetical protein [Stellaceae bacterium]